MSSPFLLVALMGGCVPLVPTANSPFFTIRSRAEPADAPVATMRDDNKSTETKDNNLFI
jgi:hypothetical protein